MLPIADPRRSRLHLRTSGASPRFDIWEEEQGPALLHTACLRSRALEAGAAWLRERRRDGALARHAIAREAQEHPSPAWMQSGCRMRATTRSRSPGLRRPVGQGARYRRDSGGDPRAASAVRQHAVRDPRMQATLRAAGVTVRCGLCDQPQPSGLQGARPWAVMPEMFISPAARTTSRRSARRSSVFWLPRQRRERSAWLARGDAFLETVRDFTPPTGEMSEQFDQRTGEQTLRATSRLELRGVHLLHDCAAAPWLGADGSPPQPRAADRRSHDDQSTTEGAGQPGRGGGSRPGPVAGNSA